MGPIASFDDIADMVQRRAAMMILIMVVGFLVSATFGLSQAPVYRSVEVLQIAPPKVSDDLAATSVGAPLATGLPLLRERLLTTATLSEIARAYDLFPDQPQLSGAQKAAQLREALRIDWGGGASESTVVVISAELPVPEQARLIAQELSHRLIRLSAAMRISEAQATLDFLSGTERALRAELAAQQARMAVLDATADAEARAALARDTRRTRAALYETEQLRDRAATGLDLETRWQSERLVVIEPALRPDQPALDRRMPFIILGGALSAIAAFAAALVAEMRHPVIRSADHMQRVTGILPVISVPHADLRPVPAGPVARLVRAFGQRTPKGLNAP